MLKNLIKHEWKATWKLVCLANLAALLVTGLISFSLFFGLRNTPDNQLLVMFAMMGASMMISIVSAAVCFYMFFRFYKNFYTDEGYLMHTLPVTTGQLLFSKTLLSFLFMLLTTLIISACAFMLAFISIYAMVPGAKDTFFHQLYQDLIAPMLVSGGWSLSGVALVCVLYLIIGTLSGVLMGYGAISLGQLFSKHKLVASVFCYAAIYILSMIATMAVMFPTLFASISGSITASVYGNLFLAMLILSLVFCILMYPMIYYIMHKKLNLD